jgi:hypothetical protein
LYDAKLIGTAITLFAVANYRSIGKDTTWSMFFNDFEELKMAAAFLKRDIAGPRRLGALVNRIAVVGNMFPGDSLGRLLMALAPEDKKREAWTILGLIRRRPQIIYEVVDNRMSDVQSIIDDWALLG